jgi:hypothetical protein
MLQLTVRQLENRKDGAFPFEFARGAVGYGQRQRAISPFRALCRDDAVSSYLGLKHNTEGMQGLAATLSKQPSQCAPGALHPRGASDPPDGRRQRLSEKAHQWPRAKPIGLRKRVPRRLSRPSGLQDEVRTQAHFGFHTGAADTADNPLIRWPTSRARGAAGPRDGRRGYTARSGC